MNAQKSKVYEFLNYVQTKEPVSKQCNWLVVYIKSLLSSETKELQTNIIIIDEESFHDNVFLSHDKRGALLHYDSKQNHSGFIGSFEGHIYTDRTISHFNNKTLIEDKEAPFYLAFHYPNSKEDEFYNDVKQTLNSFEKHSKELNINTDLDNPNADYLFATIGAELTIESLLDTIIYEKKKSELEAKIEQSLLENDKKAFLSHTKALNSLEKPACLYFIME